MSEIERLKRENENLRAMAEGVFADNETLRKEIRRLRWSHNVQYIRIAMPPNQDAEHHQRLVKFVSDLDDMCLRHFGAISEVALGGFYRADTDWDNVEKPDAMTNFPTRGSNSDGLDNEP